MLVYRVETDNKNQGPYAGRIGIEFDRHFNRRTHPGITTDIEEYSREQYNKYFNDGPYYCACDSLIKLIDWFSEEWKAIINSGKAYIAIYDSQDILYSYSGKQVAFKFATAELQERFPASEFVAKLREALTEAAV